MYSNVPNLFIIGAAKSGTTTLYSILSQHPQIFMSSPKATGFFNKDGNYEKGMDWYLRTYFGGAGRYPIRGEATPSYLASAHITAPRIKQLSDNKQIKFISIFRNPVERAYSHYWYNFNKKIRGGEDVLSFEQAIEFERERDANEESTDVRISHARDYLKNGEYSRHLNEYLKYFDRGQFLFLLTEDLYEEQFENTANSMFRFLGVDEVSAPYRRDNPSRKVGKRKSVQFIRKHRGLIGFLKAYLPAPIQGFLKYQYTRRISQPVRYPPMSETTRGMLLETYISGITELEEMIGRDLSGWKK